MLFETKAQTKEAPAFNNTHTHTVAVHQLPVTPFSLYQTSKNLFKSLFQTLTCQCRGGGVSKCRSGQMEQRQQVRKAERLILLLFGSLNGQTDLNIP